MELNKMFALINNKQTLPWRAWRAISVMPDNYPVPSIKELPEKRLETRKRCNQSAYKCYPSNNIFHIFVA